MNIYEKIQKVSMIVKNIEKDMMVGSGNYSYKAVSDIAVTIAVKDAEAEVGIVSIPIKQELVSSEVHRTMRQDANGAKEIVTYIENIKMTVRIFNIENPDEYVDVETFGKGLDSGDKGFGKASTYARKYALLNAYKIATGDDPDKDASPQSTDDKKPQQTPTPPVKGIDPDAILKKRAGIEISSAKTMGALNTIYVNYDRFHGNVGFEKLVQDKRNELSKI